MTETLKSITEFTVSLCGGGPFIVADECVGIRSFRVLMLLSVMMAVTASKKKTAVITTLSLAIPIAVMSNQLRVAFLVLAHPYVTSCSWQLLHQFSGYFTFLLALFLIYKVTLFKT